eukprot:EG_transcript_24093
MALLSCGCVLLLLVLLPAPSGSISSERLWRYRGWAETCEGAGPDLLVVDSLPSLNLVEWRGRAQQFHQWMCDALRGTAGGGPDPTEDLLGCGRDLDCLHDLWAMANLNVELALGDDATLLAVRNISDRQPHDKTKFAHSKPPPAAEEALPIPDRDPILRQYSAPALTPSLAFPLGQVTPVGGHMPTWARERLNPDLLRLVVQRVQVEEGRPAAMLQRLLDEGTGGAAVAVPLRRRARGPWEASRRRLPTLPPDALAHVRDAGIAAMNALWSS